MELIANGTLWYYDSYNHKAAIEEMQKSYPNIHIHKNESVPYEIKLNHKVMRIGKLRTMTFDPDGFVEKMYIGHSFKYAKKFLPSDIGEIIKPIIKLHADKYALIKAGIAADENVIIMKNLFS
jgi:hypothetical protein